MVQGFITLCLSPPDPQPPPPLRDRGSPPTCLKQVKKNIWLETIHRHARLWVHVVAPYSIVSHCALSASWLTGSQVRVCICDFADQFCQNHINILVKPFSFPLCKIKKRICETKKTNNFLAEMFFAGVFVWPKRRCYTEQLLVQLR